MYVYLFSYKYIYLFVCLNIHIKLVARITNTIHVKYNYSVFSLVFFLWFLVT